MNSLVITWLYSRKMNIYGDRGNVIALAQRAKWRGIDVLVRESGIGEEIPEDSDIFFFGGGQDLSQVRVSHDLAGAKGEQIRAAIERGAAMLSICGGYQLLGHEYRPYDAEPLPGIGVFDVVSTAGPERFIGNVVVDSQWGELVGFENHSGLTFPGQNATPMGKVKVGRGNNGQDGTEGVMYKNALGCYMHGSLLPKNPILADWLIEAGLRHRGELLESLPPLSNGTELEASTTARQRAFATH